MFWWKGVGIEWLTLKLAEKMTLSLMIINDDFVTLNFMSGFMNGLQTTSPSNDRIMLNL